MLYYVTEKDKEQYMCSVLEIFVKSTMEQAVIGHSYAENNFKNLTLGTNIIHSVFVRNRSVFIIDVLQ